MDQYKFGKNEEKKLLILLKEKFKNIKHTIEKYNNWDFEDEDNKIKIEVKSRTIKSDHYNSAVLGSNKIYNGKKLLKEGYRIFYIFNYTDKIFYYELNKYDKFKQAYFNDKYHSFINKNKLKEFNNIII